MSMRLSQLFSDIPAMFYFLEEEEVALVSDKEQKLFTCSYSTKILTGQLIQQNVSTGQQLTFLRVFSALLCFFGI